MPGDGDEEHDGHTRRCNDSHIKRTQPHRRLPDQSTGHQNFNPTTSDRFHDFRPIRYEVEHPPIEASNLLSMSNNTLDRQAAANHFTVNIILITNQLEVLSSMVIKTSSFRSWITLQFGS